LVKQLVDEFDVTATIQVWTGLSTTVLNKIESRSPIHITVQRGIMLPAHASGGGKLFLAFMPEQELQEFRRTVTLERFTEKTITDWADLETELEKIRREGLAYAFDDFAPGFRVVAAPIFTRNRLVATLNAVVEGPSYNEDTLINPRLVSRLKELAKIATERMQKGKSAPSSSSL
jgi:DNA-binding IclR family transcriptional regulator